MRRPKFPRLFFAQKIHARFGPERVRNSAQRVWRTREDNFIESQDGYAVMHTTAMAHLGGATLDNEENYLIKKLFSGGLGMVCISNQARI